MEKYYILDFIVSFNLLLAVKSFLILHEKYINSFIITIMCYRRNYIHRTSLIGIQFYNIYRIIFLILDEFYIFCWLIDFLILHIFSFPIFIINTFTFTPFLHSRLYYVSSYNFTLTKLTSNFMYLSKHQSFYSVNMCFSTNHSIHLSQLYNIAKILNNLLILSFINYLALILSALHLFQIVTNILALLNCLVLGYNCKKRKLDKYRVNSKTLKILHKSFLILHEIYFNSFIIKIMCYRRNYIHRISPNETQFYNIYLVIFFILDEFYILSRLIDLLICILFYYILFPILVINTFTLIPLLHSRLYRVSSYNFTITKLTRNFRYLSKRQSFYSVYRCFSTNHVIHISQFHNIAKKLNNLFSYAA